MVVWSTEEMELNKSALVQDQRKDKKESENTFTCTPGINVRIGQQK